MIEKTIKAVLKKKFNEWVKSIKDEYVRNLARKNTLITGGSIASLLMNEKPNDYDLYFKDFDTVLAISKYYVDQFNSQRTVREAVIQIVDDSGSVLSESGILSTQYKNTPGKRIKIFIQSEGVAGDTNVLTNSDSVEQQITDADAIDATLIDGFEEPEVEDEDNIQEKYRPVYLTSNAITLSDQIQIIIRFYGTAQEIHENFDFVHCMNYYVPDSNFLGIKKEALMSIMNKNLVYNGSLYPVCSVIRTRKFIRKGWHINAGHYLKMMFQISKLDLSDISVLEDQLIGVDSAYFGALISGLKKKRELDSNFEITEDYVVSIVDRIFN